MFLIYNFNRGVHRKCSAATNPDLQEFAAKFEEGSKQLDAILSGISGKFKENVGRAISTSFALNGVLKDLVLKATIHGQKYIGELEELKMQLSDVNRRWEKCMENTIEEKDKLKDK
jgi:hypothetical protein